MDVDYVDDYEDYGDQADQSTIGEVDRLIGIGFFAIAAGALFVMLKVVIGVILNSGKQRQSTNLENAKIQW